MNENGNSKRIGVGNGDESGANNGDEQREGEELEFPPHHYRSRVEDVEEDMTRSGDEEPQPRDLTRERSRRAIRGIRLQGRKGVIRDRE